MRFIENDSFHLILKQNFKQTLPSVHCYIIKLGKALVQMQPLQQNMRASYALSYG